MVCIQEDDSSYTVTLGNAVHRSLVSTPYGIVVHNEGYSDLLYLVRNDGNIQSLFHIPCLSSVSAITVCGSEVILSFKRYEKYGDLKIGMKRYVNDTKEGVYRISLKDFSVTKISDTIFNGLYIFSKNVILGCDDNCNVYFLTMDGDIMPILTNPKAQYVR